MNDFNELKMSLESRSINESFCRTAIAAFVSQADPTLDELIDIKTAVSEAITNCVVHAYPESCGKIYITVRVENKGKITIKIRDCGKGIADIKRAMEPMYTTAGDERSGLGFLVMETSSDKLSVRSALQKGTTVTIVKQIWGKKLHER